MTLAPGALVAEKYRVRRLLGAGGMGAVYLATNIVTRMDVALKVMAAELVQSQEAARRFLQEARAVSVVRHPAIVRIYDAGEGREGLWIAMELLHGETLRDRLTRAPLFENELREYVRQLLGALELVHRAGIVHRDLKPENLFLERTHDSSVQLRILDFGIAKLGDAALSTFATQAGVVMGTPHYLAPEQAQNAKDVDQRADVFAFGVILYECLTGTLPWDGDSLVEILTNVLHRPPKPMSTLPALQGHAHTALACIAIDRTDRPASAHDVAAMLVDGTGERTVGSRGRYRKPGTWTWFVLGLAAPLVAAAYAGLHREARGDVVVHRPAAEDTRADPRTPTANARPTQGTRINGATVPDTTPNEGSVGPTQPAYRQELAPARAAAVPVGGVTTLQPGPASATRTPAPDLSRKPEKSPPPEAAPPVAQIANQATAMKSPSACHGSAACYEPYLLEAAKLYQLPVELVQAVAGVCSNFDPNAVSVEGAMGLMQLQPETADQMGIVDPFDPRQNILGGARYLRILANQWNGDFLLSVASYSAGPETVAKHRSVPAGPTQLFVDRVLAQYRSLRNEALPATPSREDVLGAMKGVAGKVQACGGGQSGIAMAQVTVAGSGKVNDVDVSGQFAGTPAASCISKEVAKAKFTKFSQSTFSFSYPFKI